MLKLVRRWPNNFREMADFQGCIFDVSQLRETAWPHHLPFLALALQRPLLEGQLWIEALDEQRAQAFLRIDHHVEDEVDCLVDCSCGYGLDEAEFDAGDW